MAARKRRKKGDGSVYQRKDGRWEAALIVNGKLRRKTAADRSSAEAKLAELKQLAASQIDIDRGAQSVGDWLRAYFARQEDKELRSKTLVAERELIERYLLPHLDDQRLDKLTPERIQAVLNAIRDDITAHTTYDGARTTRMCADILRRMCAMAVRRRAIPYSPYIDIVLPRHHSHRVEPLDDDGLRAFLAAAGDHRLAALWYCYALLGLRRGEGLGLLWAHVDWERRTLTVARQIVEAGGELVPQEYVKTEAGTRLLPLIDPLPELLRRHWEQQQIERTATGRWQEHGLVFPSTVGTPIWPHTASKIFRGIRDRAGVQTTLHGLRHGVATMLAEVPVSELIIAAILGHGEHSITSRYTHPRVAAMRTALDAVAQRIGAVELSRRQTGT